MCEVALRTQRPKNLKVRGILLGGTNFLGPKDFASKFFLRQGCLNKLLVLIGHMFLGDVQFGVASRTDIRKKTCLYRKMRGLHAQNMITILNCLVNITGGI